jgi:nitroimidazol reductase NimA-like FMN-containing flavoprotein (pyridoxamine 5'-phosphate oxidase superfamily)
MSLATCANGKPWVCEVHFAYDDDLNIYFRSLESRRHSQEIASNPNVAGNIVEQHDLTMKPRGVYFEGTAEKLENVTEDNPAYIAISKRMGLGPELLEEAQKEDGHKFYKISVENFYLFDSRESKPSNKYTLSWKG